MHHAAGLSAGAKSARRPFFRLPYNGLSILRLTTALSLLDFAPLRQVYMIIARILGRCTYAQKLSACTSLFQPEKLHAFVTGGCRSNQPPLASGADPLGKHIQMHDLLPWRPLLSLFLWPFCSRACLGTSILAYKKIENVNHYSNDKKCAS